MGASAQSKDIPLRWVFSRSIIKSIPDTKWLDKLRRQYTVHCLSHVIKCWNKNQRPKWELHVIPSIPVCVAFRILFYALEFLPVISTAYFMVVFHTTNWAAEIIFLKFYQPHLEFYLKLKIFWGRRSEFYFCRYKWSVFPQGKAYSTQSRRLDIQNSRNERNKRLIFFKKTSPTQYPFG